MYLYEKMNVAWTYYGNYFTIYVNQIIMLYTLNLCNDVCQLFFNYIVGKSQICDIMDMLIN